MIAQGEVLGFVGETIRALKARGNWRADTVVPPFQDGIPIDVNPQAGGRPKAPFGLGYPVPARWAWKEWRDFG